MRFLAAILAVSPAGNVGDAVSWLRPKQVPRRMFMPRAAHLSRSAAVAFQHKLMELSQPASSPPHRLPSPLW